MDKKRSVGFLLLALSLCFSAAVSAETIILKSGEKIEGKIIERTDEYIKIDFYGVPIPYYFEDIERIDSITPNKEREETRLPRTTAVDLSSSEIDAEHIRRQLKELGYPEDTWPDIERELTAFLVKIDFPRLKKEAARVKSNPSQLKDYISGIGRLIKQEGCLSVQPPHPLIVLLVSGLGAEDVFSVIETSIITEERKEKLTQDTISCSAISQLGSIILDSLNFNVRAVYSRNHVLNCIPLDGESALFIDFTNQIFGIVDINKYYKLEGKYRVLKEECRLNPDRVYEMKKQWLAGSRSGTLKEAFNYLYFYFYITDNYTVTPCIYGNRSAAYMHKGDPNQAIAACNQALRIDPNYAQAYHNRGQYYTEKGDLNQALSDYTHALRINPNFVSAYVGRGRVYSKKGNHKRAIDDYTQALRIDQNCALAYSNRAAVLIDKGSYTQAIADCTQAIQIDPQLSTAYSNRAAAYNFIDNYEQSIADCKQALQINPTNIKAYYNRAVAYSYIGDYAMAWEDVHKAQALGLQVHPGFLQDLRRASGRQR